MKSLVVALALSASSVAAMGVRGDPDVFYPIFNGFPQYQQSLDIGSNHVFSPMFVFKTSGFAGYSFVWIRGTPWLLPVYYPDTEVVHQLYPWLPYPPIAGDLCRYDLTC